MVVLRPTVGFHLSITFPDTEGSVPTDPLKALPTDNRGWMGNRMTRCNPSESVC